MPYAHLADYPADIRERAARVRLAAPISAAHRANLLEEPAEELSVEDGAIAVAYAPFEVITLVVRCG